MSLQEKECMEKNKKLLPAADPYSAEKKKAIQDIEAAKARDLLRPLDDRRPKAFDLEVDKWRRETDRYSNKKYSPKDFFGAKRHQHMTVRDGINDILTLCREP